MQINKNIWVPPEIKKNYKNEFNMSSIYNKIINEINNPPWGYNSLLVSRGLKINILTDTTEECDYDVAKIIHSYKIKPSFWCLFCGENFYPNYNINKGFLSSISETYNYKICKCKLNKNLVLKFQYD